MGREKMRLNKKQYLLIGIILAVICAAYISVRGDTYTLKSSVPAGEDANTLEVVIEDEGVIELVALEVEDGIASATFRSVGPGTAFVTVRGNDPYIMRKMYVHKSGVITDDSFFGKCTGGGVISFATMIFLLIMMQSVILKYRDGVRDDLYSYRNVINLSMIIYFASLIIGELPFMFSRSSVIEMTDSILRSANRFSMVLFPVAFVVFLLVSVSNLRLMRMEGRNWRNMLGFALGLLVCLGTLFPGILGEYLQRSTVIDVHNERGLALYVELGVENGMLAIVAYLECILLGTIIFGIKAARHIPAFDKDYILILGCQVKEDGSLTNLLKGRADRALEFARMQKEKTGKSPVFVPSGGKGSDEAVSEAGAVANYLRSVGIKDSEMLIEDRSENTEQNFRYSMDLIRANSLAEDPKLAFSTTNYHVFRSGLIASEQGIRAEGIGSSTKRYFWINAFIREFIATLYSERKRHLKVIVLLILLVLMMVLIRYLSVVL